jgi:hypothetical protein
METLEFCEKRARRLRLLAHYCPDPVVRAKLLEIAADWVEAKPQTEAVAALARLVAADWAAKPQAKAVLIVTRLVQRIS